MGNDLTASLQAYFGFKDFRPGQAEALQNLMQGRHTLVIMPTGAGKSLIFQLAALHLPGLTLVISPLIALMKDQVDSLEHRNIPATFINSALPASEQNRRLKRLTEGGYRIVYIAPERLRSVPFLEALRQQKVGLLAVDEAHCISEWGHDFRPDYLHIAHLRASLGNPLTVALTATATPQVQNDIVRLLGLQEAQRIVTGFNRPNLFLEVRYTATLPAKLQALRELTAHHKDKKNDGTAIIYVGTRRDAEDTAEFLRQVVRIEAEYYHAGLESEERSRIQEAFISGSLPVVVATNAFGMGIDRPDVRQVIHFALPGTLEAYYQEAGRAGRDGLPAKAVLLYAPDDRALQEFFIENSAITVAELRTLYETLPGRQGWMAIEDFSLLTGMPEVKVRLGLAELEGAGACERLGDAGLRMLLRRGQWNDRAVAAGAARVKEHQQHRKIQLKHMIRYAETNTCRRRIILDHFGDRGDAQAPQCCDNCLAQQQARAHPVSSAVTAVPTVEAAQMQQPQRVALIILDTVHRLHNNVGREKLAQILKGSHAADIQKFHYDRNIYYGRLAVFMQREVVNLIDQLIPQGYLKVIGGKYPVVNLTAQGESALQAKSAIPLRLPHQVSPEKIALKKVEREAGGTVEYTARLFSEGLSPEQIALQRGLTLITIYGHFARLISMGKISVEDVIPEIVRMQIEAAIMQVGKTEYLMPIKILLPDEISYGIISCVVEGWKQAHASPAAGSSPTLTIDPVTTAILDCVWALPGRLPRSGVAKLLVGSRSERVEKYQTHKLYKRLAGYSRSEVMIQIDNLLASGKIAKDEHGYLIPVKNPLPTEDAINQYLSRSHPRPLPGPWQAGWALDFHSSFTGSDWKRSQAGELAYRLKYEGDLEAIPALVDQSLALITEHPELAQVDAILPVPPSTPRSTDPVSAFATVLAQRLELTMLPALIKIRQTSPQKELHNLAQKHANVAGAFGLQSPIGGKRLLVVDDLFDSGATLEEITRLLQRAGAAKICVLTLTRTIHSDA